MSTLSVRDVTHSYPTSPRRVLTDVNLEIPEGEMVAIVGESGCGKTTLGRLISGLHQPSEGTIEFNGKDINSLRGGERKQWRRRVQMVHQDPYGSLNPGLTLAGTLAPGLLVHKVATHRTVERTMIDLLQQVGLDATPAFLNRYPHQLSGGQRQRVSIARAIGLEPDLIVADEVTSMLDVSMRVAILDLLIKFRQERGLGYAFISHDFGVVRYFARGGRIAVMFFGRIVEEGPVDEVIISPAHPYTRMLLESIPIPDPVLARERHLDQAERLIGTPAQKGCVFANRCPMVQPECRTAMPPLAPTPGASGDRPRRSACLFPERVEPLTHVQKERVLKEHHVATVGGGQRDDRPGNRDVDPGLGGSSGDQEPSEQVG
ncbi:ABC transporter ATP-binding protein [Aestuariimicrobium kwangyangense]|uniref:ABC transporter ATP-binding protein n=1 Tax=Aestuariimicrobium kwangyangense TaxID=396389 RepID=UPI0003B578B2|nr:ABC transporter ATP-binding protein [Aestuariimicrobium kwangyangense]